MINKIDKSQYKALIDKSSSELDVSKASLADAKHSNFYNVKKRVIYPLIILLLLNIVLFLVFKPETLSNKSAVTIELNNISPEDYDALLAFDKFLNKDIESENLEDEAFIKALNELNSSLKNESFPLEQFQKDEHGVFFISKD